MALEAGSVYTRLGAVLDDDGFKRFERRLRSAREEAKHGAEAHLGTDVDTRGFDRYERRLRDVDRGHGDLVRGSGRLRTAFGSLFVGGAGVAAVGAGFYGLARGVSAVTSAFEESQKVGRQTAQVLKTTHGAANITAKAVGDLATAISNKTGIDDEAIQSGANLLLTFTNIRNEAGKGNDVFNQSTQIITDMSAALGQDLNSSAIQVGKALNDPIKGVTALQRVGVSFTEKQKEQIKTLVEHGKTLDAQKLILRELNKEFGGSAAATATNTGKLKVTLGNLAESIGGAINPAIERAAGGLRKLVDGFEKGTGAGGRIRAVLTTVVGAVKDVVTWLENAGRTVVNFIQHNKDVQAIIAQVRRTFSALVDFLRTAFENARRIFRDVLPDLKTIGTTVLSVFKVMESVMQPVIRDVLPGLGRAFKGVFEVIRGVIRTIAALFRGDFAGVWKGLKGIVKGALDAVLGVIQAATRPIGHAFSAIWSGVKGALTGALAAIINTAVGFVNAIIDVINLLPFVHVGHVTAPRWVLARDVTPISAPTGPRSPGERFARGGIFEATGGLITAPGAIYGEEAPEHPEVVIPENPRYRGRAIALWKAAGSMLGIPGFAIGGAFVGQAGATVGAALDPLGASSSASSIISKLPRNPFDGPVENIGTHVLAAARNFIREKLAQGGNVLVGSAGAATGLVPQVLRALSYARSHGWTGTVTSGLRDRSKQQYLWDHAAELGLVRGVSVAAPGTSEHERGRAVDVTLWQLFRRIMGGAPRGSRLLWRGPSDPVHFSVSGHARGGIIGGRYGWLPAFAAGGARGKKKPAHTTPRPVLSAGENRGITRSLARGDRGIASLETQIQDLERRYGQKDREFGLSDEVLLVENDDGSVTVDTAAQQKRESELGALIRIRKRIRATIEEYRARIDRLIAMYQEAIARLEAAIAAAKGKARAKERAGYRSAIADYRTRIAELAGTRHTLGGDLEDSRIDLEELGKELAAVTGAAGTPAPPPDLGDLTGKDPYKPGDTVSLDAAGTAAAPDAEAVAAQATARANALAADLAAARASLAAFSGPGDLGAGGRDAFTAASDNSPIGAGAIYGAPPAASSSSPTVVVEVHSFVAPSGAEAQRLANVVAGALGAQPYTPSNAGTVG